MEADFTLCEHCLADNELRQSGGSYHIFWAPSRACMSRMRLGWLGRYCLFLQQHL